MKPSPHIVFKLSPSELAALDKPIAGDGGFQRFGRELQTLVNRTDNTITLDDVKLGRVVRLISYNPGGFEDRLRRAFGRHLQNIGLIKHEEKMDKPVVTNTSRSEPFNEGLNVRVRKLRESIQEFSDGIVLLQKLETALKAAADRLDRSSGLIQNEAKFLEALVQREQAKKADKVVHLGEPPLLTAMAERVERDLDTLVSGITPEKKL